LNNGGGEGYDGDVGIIALEIMPISSRITRSALEKDVMVREIQTIVRHFGCWVLNLCFEKIPLEDYQSAKRFRRLRIRLSSELTPCAYGKPMVLIKRRAKGSEHNRSLLCAVVKWLADLGVVVVFVYGSVALASQVFISLGDAGTVIARYIISAIVCRLVLRYELNGLRDVLTREG